MAEITVRRRGEMFQALFSALADEPDGLRARDAIAAVERRLELTPYERATFPNNPDVVRFPKVLRFSTINAVKAGWLRKRGGIWTLTDEGRQALADLPDPEDLFREAVRLYREWKASRPPDDEEELDTSESDEVGLLAAASLEEAEDGARQDILGHMARLSPYEFQDLVGELLRAMGYHVVWIAPKGKDGGLDLLAQGDPLGVNGPRIKGQVKRKPDTRTTIEELRAFLSLLEDNDVGLFVSLGGFTSDANELARRTSRRVTLMDGDGLLDLWVEHYSKIGETGQQLLPVKPVYFLALPR